MKNIKKIFLVTIALVIASSCTNNDFIDYIGIDKGKRIIRVTASVEEPSETRATLEEVGTTLIKNIQYLWEKDEIIQFGFEQGTNKYTNITKVHTVTNNGRTAQFDIEIPVEINDDFTLYAYRSGKKAIIEQGSMLDENDPTKAILPVKYFDYKANLEDQAFVYSMWDKKEITYNEDSMPPVSLSFKHLGSMMTLNVKNTGNSDITDLFSFLLFNADYISDINAAPNWLSNRQGEGGAKFDMKNEVFLENEEKHSNTLTFYLPQNTTIAKGEEQAYYVWFVPGPFVSDNKLSLFAFYDDGLEVSSVASISENTKTAIDFKTGKNYVFFAEINDIPSNTVVGEKPYSLSFVSSSDFIENSDNSLISFSFLKENNPLLLDDYNATLEEDIIELSLPATTKELVATFETNAKEVKINGVAQTSAVSINDFSEPVEYTLVAKNGLTKTYTVNITWTSPIPHIYIVTDGNVPVDSKEVYVNADVTVTANGWGDDYNGRTRIRGRGNTTWGYDKKPYRLKLDDNVALLNLATEKDWILLANYLDPTLMLNAVAFKIGQLLDLPFTNHAIPVDLTLNGVYLGNYTLTEQVEMSASRVNIDKNEGVLLELDTNFDEDYQFRSDNYNLPVMVKDPDVESEAHFQKIKDDFHQLENAIAAETFPNSGYKDYIDIESLVKYLIVYNLTNNMEINHPKSTYLYKDATDKYKMGPIWDFDWAYGFEESWVHFENYNLRLFKKLHANATGYDFFTRIIEDPEVVELYEEMWDNFHRDKMSLLLNYIDFYAASIAESQRNDAVLWPVYSTTNFAAKIEQLKTWLQNRAIFMNGGVGVLK